MPIDIDVGQHWKQLGTKLSQNSDQHSWAFYDGCIMLGLSGAQLQSHSDAFLKSIKDLAATV
jgi:hypothetical protein